MSSDPASLSNLRDLAEPGPVSWWPLAPGWWVLTGVLVITLAVATFRRLKKYRANAYRRAALGEHRGHILDTVQLAAQAGRTAARLP